MRVVPVVEEPKEVEISSRIEKRGKETPESAQPGATGMVLAVVVPFLNEGDYLPLFLESIDAQTRRPDQLILVDDGSQDGSYELAQAFADAHPYAIALRRPRRPAEADRLATAAELRAFEWGVGRIEVPYDVVVKLDADLSLRPSHFAEILSHLDEDPRIGVAGAYLSTHLENGAIVRERHPADHVRGPNKFYRRECFEQIMPLPAHLGWDTIDEVKARMHGWRTTSVGLSGGDSIHLRPTGLRDGRLRAFARWGECAYGFGSHPITVVAGGVARLRRRPYLLAGAAFVWGWINASLRDRPRADPEVRSFRHREEFARLRDIAASRSLAGESAR
jgi:glycosyltransferase involved in cell wall biosynthesis